MIFACETMGRRKPVETLSMHTSAWGLRPAFFLRKEGDPLLPMMLILAMEPLQRNLHKGTDGGIQLPQFP